MPKQTMTPAQLADLLVNLPPGATIELKKTTAEEFTVTNSSQTKSQLIAQKYSHLAGRGISITDAADRYGVPRGAIRNWVYVSNYINFVDRDTYPQLIDEAEVALCAEIYQDRQAAGTSGLPYFDEAGLIITDVKRPASSRNKTK